MITAYAQFRGLISETIRQGQKQGEFDKRINGELFAAFLVGALDGLFLQAGLDPSIDVKGAAESACEVMLEGMNV